MQFDFDEAVRPAWTEHEIDFETVVEIAAGLTPTIEALRLRGNLIRQADFAGLVIEAARYFQNLHFSVDGDYWSIEREGEFYDAVGELAARLVAAIERKGFPEGCDLSGRTMRSVERLLA